MLVALGLDQHIQNLALGVDGAPQVNHAPIDFQVDLVKMPDRMRSGTALSQFRCNDRSEMIYPASDCFVRNYNSALREQILDVTKAKREPEIEPDHLVNDLRREPISGVADFRYALRLPSRRRRDNALATHSAHRIFDALEDAYPDLIGQMPLGERAALLKALLVHTASWRGSDDFIRSVIDPLATLHHEYWRREVCRHLGYGFVDPEDAIACAADRATMWATGTIGPEGSITFDLPVPAVFATNADLREVRATLAWFTPTRPGYLAYRAVKLRIPLSNQRRSKSLALPQQRDSRPTANRRAEQSCIVDGLTPELAMPSAARQSLSKFSGSAIKARLLTRPFRLVLPSPSKCRARFKCMTKSCRAFKFGHGPAFALRARW